MKNQTATQTQRQTQTNTQTQTVVVVVVEVEVTSPSPNSDWDRVSIGFSVMIPGTGRQPKSKYEYDYQAGHSSAQHSISVIRSDTRSYFYSLAASCAYYNWRCCYRYFSPFLSLSLSVMRKNMSMWQTKVNIRVWVWVSHESMPWESQQQTNIFAQDGNKCKKLFVNKSAAETMEFSCSFCVSLGQWQGPPPTKWPSDRPRPRPDSDFESEAEPTAGHILRIQQVLRLGLALSLEWGYSRVLTFADRFCCCRRCVATVWIPCKEVDKDSTRGVDQFESLN